MCLLLQLLLLLLLQYSTRDEACTDCNNNTQYAKTAIRLTKHDARDSREHELQSDCCCYCYAYESIENVVVVICTLLFFVLRPSAHAPHTFTRFAAYRTNAKLLCCCDSEQPAQSERESRESNCEGAQLRVRAIRQCRQQLRMRPNFISCVRIS